MGILLCLSFLPAGSPVLALAQNSTASINSLSPATQAIAQGGSTVLTITLNAAPKEDSAVDVVSSMPAVAFVPSQVQVMAGQTRAFVTVQANAPGTSHIRAMFNGTSATSAITVTASQPSVISLLPPTTPILLGATGTLTVTLSAAQAAETVVQLSSSPSELVVIPPSVIIPAGAISAPVPVSTVAMGQAMVRASLGSSSAEAVVRITSPLPAVADVQPKPLTLTAGANGLLTVTLNAVQGVETRVMVTADNPQIVAVAGALKIPAGQVQVMAAISGRAAGEALLTVSIGDSAMSVPVRVLGTDAVPLALIPNPYLLQERATGSVTVTVSAASRSDMLFTLMNSAPDVLQVPPTVTVPAGRTTAEFPVTGLIAGNANLTASAGGMTVATMVQVIQPQPVVVSMVPASLTLTNGSPGTLTISVSPAPMVPTPITVVSQTPGVVEVPQSVTIPAGMTSADLPVVTRTSGTAAVTASLGGRTTTALVTVTDAQLMSLAVTPTVPSVGVGDTLALRATGLYTDGTTRDLTAGVLWRAADPTIATLSSAGLVTAVTVGTTALSATAETVTVRTMVTVGAAVPRLSLTPANATLAIGQSVEMAVMVTPPATNTPVTVSMTSSGVGSVGGLLASLVIPVGQNKATVTLSGLTAGAVTLTAAATGRASASSVVTVTAEAAGPKGPPGQPVMGRVYSAADGKPLRGVQVLLAGQSTTTDQDGRFVFSSPASGYQLVTVDHASLDPYRKRKKDGTAGGLMHADPVLVNVAPDRMVVIPDPIWVVQTSGTLYPITPGQRADVRPANVPGLTLSIPEGTTIRGTDGQANTKVSITPVPPDRVPRLPDTASPATVYLVSFEKHGGGTPSKPVPIITPNDLNADPGTRVQFWYYDKSPQPDPKSHQWKMAGYAKVSQDGRSIVPDPGVGTPQFCYVYFADVASTNTQRCPPDAQSCTAADPVDVSSGVFSMEKTDMVLPGVLPVHITRIYRSKSEGIGPFGQGGSFNYHMYLSVVGSALRLQMPDQSRYLFSQDPDGKYRNAAYPLFQGAAITKNPDGSAELRWRDGSIYAFNPWGWLNEQRDRYSNRIQIVRDSNTPRITQIIEPSGRALTFAYTSVKRGFSTFDVIGSITDPTGRSVTYTYYIGSNGRLTRVTDPSGGVPVYVCLYDGGKHDHPDRCDGPTRQCHDLPVQRVAIYDAGGSAWPDDRDHDVRAHEWDQCAHGGRGSAESAD
jgi:hypothetical protein